MQTSQRAMKEKTIEFRTPRLAFGPRLFHEKEDSWYRPGLGLRADSKPRAHPGRFELAQVVQSPKASPALHLPNRHSCPGLKLYFHFPLSGPERLRGLNLQFGLCSKARRHWKSQPCH